MPRSRLAVPCWLPSAVGAKTPSLPDNPDLRFHLDEQRFPPGCHDERHDPVDAVPALRLVGLDVPGRVLLDRDVRGHPRQNGVAAVGDATSEDELLELL